MTNALNIEASWNAVAALTVTMRGAADMENWTEVLELATNRHAQVMQHFAQFPVGPENSNFYRERIGEMLNGEQELLTLAIEARKQVMRSAMTSSHNHRAVGAYLNTAAR